MTSGPPHDRTREFERVALEHLPALYNLAYHLTRNAGDAEDLVQETYLRAFRFFETYRPGTRIKAWLFRILRNTFINHYRSARSRPDEVDFAKIDAAYESLIEAEFLRHRQPPAPDRLLLDGAVDPRVTRALARLPEEFRMVVVMALVEGMPYREIASALSVPIGTVMSRLHRGRKLLQAELLDYARRRGIIRHAPRLPGTSEPDAGEGTTP